MADCYEGDAASAQGTTVSWGGSNLGMLTSVQVRAGRSQLMDVTSVNATVLGSGTNSRVLREVQVASVEPASVSLTAYSTGITVNQNDRGDTRMLSLNGDGWNYYGQCNTDGLQLNRQRRRLCDYFDGVSIHRRVICL